MSVDGRDFVEQVYGLLFPFNAEGVAEDSPGFHPG